MKSWKIMRVVVVIFIVIGTSFILWREASTISTYNECKNAGYETLNTEPYDICITPEGVQYMELLENPDEYVVKIENVFEERIVYASVRLNEMPVIEKDCRRRGGILNTCGSGCRDGEECELVCRVTCEF